MSTPIRPRPRAHDGKTKWCQRGPDERLVAAEWPHTRLTTEACDALSNLASISQLDLSGHYFPNDILDLTDIETLSREPELEHLSLHGVSVSAEALLRLVTRAG